MSAATAQPTRSALDSLQSWLASASTSELIQGQRYLLKSAGPAGAALIASQGRWKPARHLQLLNRKLIDVMRGRTKRLAVFMPPRHGKSELVSKYFPASWLGENPDDRVMLASYEAGFAASWGRKVRDLMHGEIGDLCDVHVREDSKAANSWDLSSRLGGMTTAGVGGPMTGKGARLLIIDDPVKNAEEASSATIQQRNWDWYTSTAYTRLEPDGAVVLLQTRWHQMDLGGQILSHATENGEHWDVVNLPAIAEENDLLGRSPGEALWPERFDLAGLERIKKTIGAYWFSALYQQRPSPASGGKFLREWFRYHRASEAGDGVRKLDNGPAVNLRDCRKFGVLDLAFSQKREADWTVLGAFGVDQKSNLLLLDLDRRKIEAPGLVAMVRNMVDRHNLAYVCVEANGAQLAIVQGLRNAGITIRPLHAEADKLTRSLTAQVRCETGQVYFPWGAPWLAEFEDELLLFPRGRHDDQVDVLSYGALEVFRFGAASEPEETTVRRENDAAKARSDAWHSQDNEAWWGQ